MSRAAYGKLSRLYRTQTLARLTNGDGGSSTIGLSLADASLKLAELEAAAAAAGVVLHSTDHAVERPLKKQKREMAPAAAGSKQDTGIDRRHENEDLSDVDSESSIGAEDIQECDATGHSSAAGDGICSEARIAELEAALAASNQQQSQQQEKGAAETGGSVGGQGRSALHQRIFALLLRYKSIQGHGFQASWGKNKSFLCSACSIAGMSCNSVQTLVSF